MTTAVHSIVDTAREASREAEQTVIHVEALIAKLQAKIAEMRRDNDLAKAWIGRRAFAAEQAQRLAERAAIAPKGGGDHAR
jgi:hypothetical protein